MQPSLLRNLCYSYDGVPFVIHDADLRRTTNVASVFPDRADMKACQFNMTDLKMLSAGEWFHKVWTSLVIIIMFFLLFPFCRVRLVIHHSAVRLLMLFFHGSLLFAFSLHLSSSSA